MFKSITKRSISLLLVFSMLISLFPMTVFADDEREVVTEIVGSLVTSKGDDTPLSFEDVFVYGADASQYNHPYIKTVTGYPAYFYNSHWEKETSPGGWEEIASSGFPVKTFTSGNYRYVSRIYIDNDDGNGPLATGGDEYRFNEDVAITVGEETWTKYNYSSSSNSTSITVYKDGFTMPVPLELQFPMSTDYSIPENWVGTAIRTLDVSQYTEGGTAPYTYIFVSGPTWLSVSEAGIISGTPTAVADSNPDLVVMVTDSAEATKQISIPVGVTRDNPNNRTVVSNIVATSEDIDEIATVGHAIEKPTIVVSSNPEDVDVGYPAYFYNTNSEWQVFNGESWVTASGTFEAGCSYRYAATVYVDNDSTNGPLATAGDEYRLLEDPLPTITLNEEAMTVSAEGGYFEPNASKVVAYSKTYVMPGEAATVTGSISVPSIDDLEVGYDEQLYTAIDVTLTNTGIVDSNYMQATLSGEDDESFELDTNFGGNMEAPNTWDNVLYVRPIEGLAVGTYNATITLKFDSDEDGVFETTIGSDDVSVTVVEAGEQVSGTAFEASVSEVDFGTLQVGFTEDEAIEHGQTVRFTNTGTTTITIGNTNPSSSGPFASQSYDCGDGIVPGGYIDITIRPKDGSGLAAIPDEYEGTYVFTATNVEDAEDTVEVNINASIVISKREITEIELTGSYIDPVIGEAIPELENEIASVNGSEGLADILDLDYIKWQKRTGEGMWDYEDAEGTFEEGEEYILRMFFTIKSSQQPKNKFPATDVTVTLDGATLESWQKNDTTLGMWLTDDVTPESAATKTQLTIPTLEEDELIYNKEEKTVTINDLDDDYCTVTGDTSATAVGNYTITISINDTENYEWIDGTTDDIVLNWSIVLPEFEGSITTPTFDNAEVGYEPITDKAVLVTISNTYVISPSRLEYEITGTNSSDYTVYLNKTAGMLNGDGSWNNFFFVGPNDNLPAGTYTATLTLKYDADNDSVYELTIGSGDLSFTVTEPETSTTHTITFDGNGHGIPPITTLEVEDGKTIWDYISDFEEVRMEDADGCSFIDWSLSDTNDVTEWFDFDTPITADLVLYAIWCQQTHDVTFNSNGGGEVEKQIINDGEYATKPEDPTNGDLYFAGWFENPTIDNLYLIDGESISYNTFDFENTAITGDVELTALWVATATVNVSGSGDGQINFAPSDQELEFDDEYPYTSAYINAVIGLTNDIIIGAKADEYNTFVKWTKDGEDYSTNTTLTETITANTEYVAVFEPIECTISFNANGGNGEMDSITVEAGTEYTLPECVFEAPNGKVFDKWDLGKKGANITVTEDVELVAQWKNKTVSGGGGGSSTPTYKITTKINNGTVTPSNPQVKKNESQEFKFVANDGYEITDVLVDGKSVGVVSKYTLNNVTGKHTIEVKTAKIENAVDNNETNNGNTVKPANQFKDVKQDDWFYNSVNYVVENGLFKGITEDTFAPGLNLTRGMLVTVLYRFSGEKEIEKSTFDDVAKNAYYSEAIAWATKNEIVNGIGNNKFNPDVNVTRQDMATIIYRYMNLHGKGFTGMWAFLLDYNDRDEIAEYAYEPICYLTMNEIITGRPGKIIDPKGFATRAEAAAIMERIANFMK